MERLESDLKELRAQLRSKADASLYGREVTTEMVRERDELQHEIERLKELLAIRSKNYVASPRSLSCCCLVFFVLSIFTLFLLFVAD